MVSACEDRGRGLLPGRQTPPSPCVNAVLGRRSGLLRRVYIAFARNEASPAIEGKILKSPLNKNEHAVLELHNVHEVNEQPDDPGWPSPNMKTKDISDGSRTADHRNIAFIEVAKWRQSFRAIQP